MGAYKADEESGNTYVLCKRIRRTPPYYLMRVRYESVGRCFRNKGEQHVTGIGQLGLMVMQRTSFHYASAGRGLLTRRLGVPTGHSAKFEDELETSNWLIRNPTRIYLPENIGS